MRTSFRVAVLALFALLAAACGGSAASEGEGSLPAGAVATVNGDEIAADQFENVVTSQVNAEDSPFADLEGEERTTQIAQLQRQVLSQMILIAVIDQAADERGITVSDEEVQERWEQEAGLQEGGEEQLLELIADLGLTEEQARAQLATQIKQEKLQEEASGATEVPDEELRAAYEANQDQFNTVTASHILVETEEEANAIKTLLDGGAAFEELATERSQDPGSAAQGGSLGTQPRGTFVPEFEAAIDSAEIGQVVGPVQTEFGFHLIRVDAFEEQTFDEVKDQLREQIAGSAGGEAFNELMMDVFANAEVEINPKYGSWDPTTGQVVSEEELTRSPGAPQVPGGTNTDPALPEGGAGDPAGTQPSGTDSFDDTPQSPAEPTLDQ